MRLTSMTRRNSSGVVSEKAAKRPTPATCTQVSSLPYSSTARAATARTCPKSAASATTAVAWPPPSRISSTSDVSPSSPLAETTTFAPRPARRRAASRPMPLEAPITTTTCCRNGLSRILSPSWVGVSLPAFASVGIRVFLLLQKTVEHLRETIRPFDLRQVAAVGDDLDRAFGQARERFPRLRDGEDTVALPPNEERRRREVGKLLEQHLPLPEGVELGAQGGELGRQKARRSRQAILLGDPRPGRALGTREQEPRPVPGPPGGAGSRPGPVDRQVSVSGYYERGQAEAYGPPQAGRGDEDERPHPRGFGEGQAQGDEPPERAADHGDPPDPHGVEERGGEALQEGGGVVGCGLRVLA